MKIAVINGTEVKGCTHHIKEAFLAPLRGIHEIEEFSSMPSACTGCKACFFEDTSYCPHAAEVEPIRRAIFAADLLVFASPVYGLSIPGGLKALLDHFTVHWMVHRPEPFMFKKRAVVLTNCIGMGFMARSSQRDVVAALSWMGVSKIRRFGVGLMEGVIWDELSKKRRETITKNARSLGLQYQSIRPTGKSVKVRTKFLLCKVLHRMVAKNEETLSADNRYWAMQGWLKL